MPVIGNSPVIRCSPGEVFDYLSDHRSELDWNPSCQVMEKMTDGPVRAGTRFRAKWKLSPVVELEILERDRPRAWKVHTGGALEVTFSCRLEPARAGTRLNTDVDVRPPGPLRLIFPVLLRRLRAEEKANMSHIREALERGHSPTQPDAEK